MQFFDAGSSLGTVIVSGGIATLTTSALTQGTHSITARYGGDVNNAVSVSSVLQQMVNAVVVGPAGPAQPIPTMGELALLMLGALVAMTGIVAMRRHSR